MLWLSGLCRAFVWVILQVKGHRAVLQGRERRQRVSEGGIPLPGRSPRVNWCDCGFRDGKQGERAEKWNWPLTSRGGCNVILYLDCGKREREGYRDGWGRGKGRGRVVAAKVSDKNFLWSVSVQISHTHTHTHNFKIQTQWNVQSTQHKQTLPHTYAHSLATHPDHTQPPDNVTTPLQQHTALTHTPAGLQQYRLTSTNPATTAA